MEAIARRHNLIVFADEIYSRMTYDGEKHTSPASLGSEAADQTITIQGCSKSFAMTGWRADCVPEAARAPAICGTTARSRRCR